MASGSESYAGYNKGVASGRIKPTGGRRRRSSTSQFDPNGAPF